MVKDYSNTEPRQKPPETSSQKQVDIASNAPLGVFPNTEQQARLSNYTYYERLFKGEHFDAFNERIKSDDYNKAYAKLRYVAVNFAGMISKIVADMLFLEPVSLTDPDGDNQDYMDALWRLNHMDIQVYEGALGNSSLGDDGWKVRIGKRHPNDKKPEVIIEQFSPGIYFPDIDPFNARAVPTSQSLMWVFNYQNQKYLRKEIHTPGMIGNEVYLMEGEKIIKKVDPAAVGLNLKDAEPTKIEKTLITHIVNWKLGNQVFGTSDYFDLSSLFYAINNRMTKTDNILDAHSDPILKVPPGMLDEKGRFKKKDHRVIEMGEGEDGKPEYIVWDASLENAFKEIEKLVEFVFMVGEVSPDVLGLGKGTADSGRALKYKLMRTIAKVARKRNYYNLGLKRVMLVAQELGKAWGIEMDGVKPGEPVEPIITFQDGIPISEYEMIETEQLAIDTGIQTKQEAIKKVYGLDDKEAEQKVKDIDAETKIEMPKMNLGKNPFTNNQDNVPPADNPDSNK